LTGQIENKEMQTSSQARHIGVGVSFLKGTSMASAPVLAKIMVPEKRVWWINWACS
jgi:hypothetical protein